MYQDASSTCRAIVIIITPFVFFKMSLTCRDNFVFVKNVMTFNTCPLVRIGPKCMTTINNIYVSTFYLEYKRSSPTIYSTTVNTESKFIFYDCWTFPQLKNESGDPHFLLLNNDWHVKTQLFAKLKEFLRSGFRATLNLRKFKVLILKYKKKGVFNG